VQTRKREVRAKEVENEMMCCSRWQTAPGVVKLDTSNHEGIESWSFARYALAANRGGFGVGWGGGEKYETYRLKHT
jgi:hypothetical protein